MFKAAELSVLAYSNNFTLWHYNATDLNDVDIVAGQGFFSNAKDMLRKGDRMLITSSDGHTYDMNVLSGEKEEGDVFVQWANPKTPEQSSEIETSETEQAA